MPAVARGFPNVIATLWLPAELAIELCANACFCSKLLEPRRRIWRFEFQAPETGRVHTERDERDYELRYSSDPSDVPKACDESNERGAER